MEDCKKYDREELERVLTKKQNLFCHEYIKDWNGSRAARDAGYSENTSKEIASENLTKPNIKQYIELIKDDIAKEAGISKLMMINKLKALAFTSLPSIYIQIEKDGIESLTEDQAGCITEYLHNKKSLGEGGSIIDESLKIKIVDPRGPIQDIMKAMAWNEAEKVDVTTKGEKIGASMDDIRSAFGLNDIENPLNEAD